MRRCAPASPSARTRKRQKKLVLDGMELSEDDLEKIDGGVIWAEL